MKEWNKKERWDLAMKLDGILGADLDPDEVDALLEAMRLISPEYAQMLDDAEQDAADWFDSTTPEERAAFVAEQMKKYPPPSPDFSGTPAVPPVYDGKVLRFGQKEQKNK